VRLLRAVDTPLAPCNEALFSVAPGEKPDAARRWFATSACRRAEDWKWAAAEPATERRGSLQPLPPTGRPGRREPNLRPGPARR
jgi:hypothetical protein